MAAVGQQPAGTARDRLRHSLKDFLSLARELFVSINRVAAGAAPQRSPPEVVAALLANDAKLTTACEDLEKMLKFEAKVRRFKKQMQQEDRVVEEVLATLKSVESKLYNAIQAAKPVADAHQAAQAQPVDLTDVMYVARNVSYTTRARPGFQPGMPMKGYLRPYPLPAEMCCGEIPAPSPTNHARHLNGLGSDCGAAPSGLVRHRLVDARMHHCGGAAGWCRLSSAE